MAPIERSAVCKASPETIWNACFENMKWEVWDPDVKAMEQVSGPCEDGTTAVFVMASDGTRIQTTLSNVVKNTSVTFAGKTLYGMMQFKGDVILTPQNKNDTKIEYTFELFGLIGSLFTWLKSDLVVGGVEKGLANMVRLSEEAQPEK